jgi:hypothetical protein
VVPNNFAGPPAPNQMTEAQAALGRRMSRPAGRSLVNDLANATHTTVSQDTGSRTGGQARCVSSTCSSRPTAPATGRPIRDWLTPSGIKRDSAWASFRLRSPRAGRLPALYACRCRRAGFTAAIPSPAKAPCRTPRGGCREAVMESARGTGEGHFNCDYGSGSEMPGASGSAARHAGFPPLHRREIGQPARESTST